jgi:N-methylhydantoinase B/oxoprolinase/acetone carboxylase alpha subunit
VKDDAGIDPITREVIRGWLETAAEEMQNALIKSAHSMLIAEGRDATAALFDEQGRTLAQASSIPVHLGVMVGLGRLIAQRYPASVAQPGDIYATNDPYAGGTHMPDIAVCVPVFHGDALVGYALTMAHHRDIGGLVPGSVRTRPPPANPAPVFGSEMKRSHFLKAKHLRIWVQF